MLHGFLRKRRVRSWLQEDLQIARANIEEDFSAAFILAQNDTHTEILYYSCYCPKRQTGLYFLLVTSFGSIADIKQVSSSPAMKVGRPDPAVLPRYPGHVQSDVISVGAVTDTGRTADGRSSDS
ncbi:hypothetical protein E1301_Tti012645 [Triplophysa tibetana]|uniref:Uncharacterized protein n=1 Tax=Triplophysa tibetana TaxID=1572043 RepID=A0A5A9PMM4_9TELE|nr:hypothetical protein E1301_Tti012645 [Triplophysa tibetana]